MPISSSPNTRLGSRTRKWQGTGIETPIVSFPFPPHVSTRSRTFRAGRRSDDLSTPLEEYPWYTREGVGGGKQLHWQKTGITATKTSSENEVTGIENPANQTGDGLGSSNCSVSQGLEKRGSKGQCSCSLFLRSFSIETPTEIHVII